MLHRRRSNRGLLAPGVLLLGIALALFCASPVQAQTALQESLLDVDNTASMLLNADAITTWKQDGLGVYWLRGNVIISQANATIRSANVLVWIAEQSERAGKTYQVTLSALEAVQFERGSRQVQADYGYFRLRTIGGMRINSHKSEIATLDQSGDPAYQRAGTNLPAGWSLRDKSSSAVLPLAPSLPQMLPSGPAQQQSVADLFPASARPLPSAAEPAGEITQPSMLPPLPKDMRPVQALPGKDETPKSNVPAYTEPSQPATASYQAPLPPMPGEPQVAPVPSLPPTQPTTPPLTIKPPPTPPGAAPAPAAGVQISVRPRYAGELQVEYNNTTRDGMSALIVTGGVNVFVTSATAKGGFLDIEADRMVIWTRSNAQQLFSNLRSPGGDINNAHELYLSGNVEIRTETKQEKETLRADEVYYDVQRNVAVARKADLELMTLKLPYPIHFQADQLIQENASLYKADHSRVFSTLLPSDPGLEVDVRDTTIQERRYVKTQLFGLLPSYDKDGNPKVVTDHIFTGYNTIFKLEGWPIFYFPYLKTRVEDPLGPLEDVNFSYNRIFGFQIYTTWDMFKLLDLDRPAGMRWHLNLDYLTARGPALGTEGEYNQEDFLGTKAKANAYFKIYGIYDTGTDLLGGDRGNTVYYPEYPGYPIPINHPTERGWATGKFNVQDLPHGFSVVGQFAFVSDRNFLEQYFMNTWLNEVNQDTYLYVKQQQDNWAWSVYAQGHPRPFLTETEWLPRVDGNLLGQTFLDDLLVYSARASAGYAQLRPTDQAPFPYVPTDARVSTARLDLRQEVSMPLYLGPVKVAPYVVGDLTYYSQDVNGDSLGRLYGGAGVRWSLPLSRLYPDVQSDLFNLNGLYHKITMTGNYFYAQSSTSLNNLPQLDRLNDDASDQALRDIRPFQNSFLPGVAPFLTTSNLFNPQNYALRRLIDYSPETLDSINALQLGLRQRLQTKRGFPGEEHVVDWMTLNINVSLFPQAQRDNFGHLFGVLEYDWKWNIGDRTALVSSGWFEPFDGGPRAFDIGTNINRPDQTNFYLGYRQIDPLQSRAVVAALTYPFSSKYAMTASTVWDFGTDVRTYSLMLSRRGTDVMVGFGVTYNSTLNTFGVAFEIMPNVGARPGTRLGQLFPSLAPPVQDSRVMP